MYFSSRYRSALFLSAVFSISIFSLAAFAQEETVVVGSSEDVAPSINGMVNVAVELLDEPSAVVYDRAVKAATPPNRPVDPATRANANALAKRHLGQIKQAQAAVLAALRDPSIDAKVFFATQRTFNGFGVNVAADRVERIRNIPGVKSVHLMVPQTIDNAGSVPFIGAPGAWIAGLGNNHGEGMRVGVIDTGIDYIHTNFGGPGIGYSNNNTTVIGDTAAFPGAKVAGGFDFAGDSYDAGSAVAANRIPKPDPDPMDCFGHGSHVAGTIAGYGVQPDGSTFTGPYDGTTPFNTLKIGPGVAPGAQLYALRVFGCSGSTNLTNSAIEWAVDPNGDGDFSDHLDVINMSLGSPLGAPFDSSAVASENAVLAGVIVVAAAGNNGDTHYIVSSPGSSPRTITVAASQDNGFPALRINSPVSIAGLKAIGKASGWGVPLTDPGVTAQVVATVPADACAAITNLAAVAGKIAFVDRGGTSPPGQPACGFELKAKNAQNAGAVGVIIGNVSSSANPLIPITMGSGAIGGVTIPAAELGLDAANQIRANVAGGINATLLRSATTTLPAAADLIGSFSSRGVGRVNNMLKPDISAPGVAIDSTLALSGNGSVEMQGTSMATPHIAGSMALLRQLHPDWSVEELKALAMNTATHDLFFNVSQTNPKYAASRIGAGRVDLANAGAASVIAMNTKGDGTVGVSFGALSVLGSGTWTREIQVINKGTTPQTYSVSLASLSHVPGAAYSLPDGSSVTVAAGETVKLHVQLDATASLLRHTLDPTMTSTQTATSGAVNNRQWMAEETGNIVLTSSSGPALRVPVHAILRPASAMATSQTAILLTAPTGTTTLNLTGTQINSGGATSNDERSLVTPLELGATSPDAGSTNSALRAADIRNVGITSDAKTRGTVTASGIYLGVSTWGNWTTFADVEFDVYIDTNRDGTFDWVVFTTAFANGTNRLDIPVSVAQNLATGAQTTVNFINNASGTTDTGLYNSNVVVIPILNNIIGLTNTNSKFNYTVLSFARGFSGTVDSVSGTFDPLHPGLNFNIGFTGAPLLLDFAGSTIATQYSQPDLNSLKSAMLVHHLNSDGARDQVLPATTPSATGTVVGAAAGQYSDGVTLTATVSPSTFFGQTISGSVAFTIDGAPVGSSAVSATGTASLPYTINVAAGPHAIAATFTSTNSFFVTSSGSAALTVTKEDASVVPDAANPALVPAPGGIAASIKLSADIAEVADGSAGNIALAAPVTVTLTPSSGSPITQNAILLVNGATERATATFTNVPAASYSIAFTVGGSFYAGSATRSLNVVTPSVTSVALVSPGGQYSDVTTLSATVTPTSYVGQALTGSVNFTVDGASVGTAPMSSTGNAAVAYAITGEAGSHAVAATFTSTNAFFQNSGGSSTLSVTREDANVSVASTNPASVQVSAPGGNASSITLAADVTEVADGSLGNIGLATMTITLTPIGPGSTLTQSAVMTGSGTTARASATFANVPVNVYDVSFTVGGNYYTGSTSSVLAVFDPSLGNVTGGGTIMHDGVRANFGFNVKYQKNGNAQGSILYIEHRPTGDLKMKSNALDTLSIAGNTAIVLGKATVADVGNYSFRLTVVDSGEPGSDDQFGLKVSKGANDVGDLTFAPITLSGGNIQVPKP